ncbi:MAG: deacylase, partial [Pyramidobacter sp.]|nr:deacylase [Pyramidobacter sp.]
TPNPAQNEHVVGADADPLTDARYPIAHRVAIQLEVIREWLGKCEELSGAPVVIEDLPDKVQIERDGVWAWLR